MTTEGPSRADLESVAPAGAPPPPEPGAPDLAPGQGYPTLSAVHRLVDYIEANRSAFTDEAIRDAAAAAGYPAEAIDAAFERIAAFPGAGPIRMTARLIILGAYGATFLALTAGMSANGNAGFSIVLAISLGVFLLLSLFLTRDRKNDAQRLQLALGGLLAVPLLFLVLIGGLCMATGLPFRPLFH